MIKMRRFAITLMSDRRGQDYMEYALMGGFAVACAASCFGGELSAGVRLGEVMQVLIRAMGRLAG